MRNASVYSGYASFIPFVWGLSACEMSNRSWPRVLARPMVIAGVVRQFSVLVMCLCSQYLHVCLLLVNQPGHEVFSFALTGMCNTRQGKPVADDEAPLLQTRVSKRKAGATESHSAISGQIAVIP